MDRIQDVLGFSCMQVTVAFDPIVPTSRSARDFLKLVSSQKIKLEYPDVVTKEVLRSDQG